jgi:lysophospholipase L1-like esterase
VAGERRYRPDEEAPDVTRIARRALLAVVAAVLLLVAGGASASASTAHRPPGHGAAPTEYYLSLGDSLAVGFQPDATGAGRPTGQGYADDLFALLRLREARHGKDLRLVKLGCPGETTASLINGGICAYPAGSQLAQARLFLAAHRGQVTLVTIDIGANDVESCVGAAGVDVACVQRGLAAVGTNLPAITGGLAQADAGSTPRFVAANYYDPFLASWLSGSDGQVLARQSVDLLGTFNRLQAAAYGAAGYRVADVAAAFRSTSFTPEVPLPRAGEVPLNVALICRLTYMCAPAPVGPNIHANPAGYAVMAATVAGRL